MEIITRDAINEQSGIPVRLEIAATIMSGWISTFTAKTFEDMNHAGVAEECLILADELMEAHNRTFKL